MWLFAPSGGFYSAVQERGDPETIRVRCRVREDAEYLIESLKALGSDRDLQIEEDTRADYLYRVLLPRETWAAFVLTQSLEIDYDNYKDNVKDRLGPERAWAYGGVWHELLRLQPLRPYSGWADDQVWMEDFYDPDLAAAGDTVIFGAGSPLSRRYGLVEDPVEAARIAALRRKPSRRRGRKQKPRKRWEPQELTAEEAEASVARDEIEDEVLS